jgi:cytochrome c-type biogenesis protein CcmH
MSVRLLVATGLALLVVGIPAVDASAGAEPVPQTSLSDVEDEVMCPICGTLLELADSPQARRQKVYIAKLIAAGRTKAEIEDALVAQYGPAVLALPEGSGFNLTAYLVPAIALVVAIVALALGVRRWRRDGSGSPGSKPRDPLGPQGDDARRLEADIDRYDL